MCMYVCVCDCIALLYLLQAELTKQEQSMTESRRERDKVLSEYRKQANEKKEFAEKVERRVSIYTTS